MTVSWEYQQHWHKSSQFCRRSQRSLSSSFSFFFSRSFLSHHQFLAWLHSSNIRCLIDAILIALSFFNCLFIWNMSSPLLMCHCPYQAHSLRLIWSIPEVCTQSDVHAFKRKFQFSLLTFMTSFILLTVFDASMRCSFANYKFSIAMKMTFFPRKGIAAQRTWSTAVPHVIICCLLYEIKKQYCRTKWMGGDTL